MMMPPNSVVSLSRGTLQQVDAGGDPIEIDSGALYADIRAVIGYTGSITDPYTSGTPRQVSAFEIYVDAGTDVMPQDRLIDQNGVTYHVTSVAPLPQFGMPPDIQIKAFMVADGT